MAINQTDLDLWISSADEDIGSGADAARILEVAMAHVATASVNVVIAGQSATTEDEVAGAVRSLQAASDKSRRLIAAVAARVR